jgi:hypothetical protein
MPDAAFRRLPLDLQIDVWQEASDVLYTMIQDGLGPTYRHLIGRCAQGDGVGCYRALLLQENVQTAGAKNAFLSSLMSLKLPQTGDQHNAASMLTYYEKLTEINAKYKKANNDVGVSTDILRAKLMELPPAYSWPAHGPSRTMWRRDA